MCGTRLQPPLQVLKRRPRHGVDKQQCGVKSVLMSCDRSAKPERQAFGADATFAAAEAWGQTERDKKGTGMVSQSVIVQSFQARNCARGVRHVSTGG